MENLTFKLKINFNEAIHISIEDYIKIKYVLATGKDNSIIELSDGIIFRAKDIIELAPDYKETYRREMGYYPDFEKYLTGEEKEEMMKHSINNRLRNIAQEIKICLYNKMEQYQIVNKVVMGRDITLLKEPVKLTEKEEMRAMMTEF